MKKSILYLDDEQNLCQIFEEYVALLGDYEVRTFTDVEDALESHAQFPSDFAFIDYRLKDTTGDKLLQNFDESTETVLVSGELNLDAIRGFDKTLTKPFMLADLRAVLSSGSAG